MRIAVVGAGVAGLTLAGLLGRQGHEVVVIERAASSGDGDAGYAIGLYPMGSRVLHALDSYSALTERSSTIERYVINDRTGRRLRAFDFSALTGSTEPTLMVRRSALIDLLTCALDEARVELRHNTVVSVLEQSPDQVRIVCSANPSDGPVNGPTDSPVETATESFDLLVGCDGIGSDVRRQVFGPGRRFDSGWVIWTWWTGASFERTTVTEWWGDDWFFGAYPAPGPTMCVFGAPLRRSGRADSESHPADLLAATPVASDPLIRGTLTELRTGAHRWPMADVRADHWVRGRVVLCGDAAVGFLPTAGVGASAALASASGLADELSRADAASAPSALLRYERRCRSVAEGSQQDSRGLARVMFLRSAKLAGVRDLATRCYPDRLILGQLGGSG